MTRGIGAVPTAVSKRARRAYDGVPITSERVLAALPLEEDLAMPVRAEFTSAPPDVVDFSSSPSASRQC